MVLGIERSNNDTLLMQWLGRRGARVFGMSLRSSAHPGASYLVLFINSVQDEPDSLFGDNTMWSVISMKLKPCRIATFSVWLTRSVAGLRFQQILFLHVHLWSGHSQILAIHFSVWCIAHCLVPYSAVSRFCGGSHAVFRSRNRGTFATINITEGGHGGEGKASARKMLDSS